MSFKTDGLTTSQVYTAMHDKFTEQHQGLATACQEIDQTRSAVNTRFTELDKGRVAPPRESGALDVEYATYFGTAKRLTIKKDEAVSLERDLNVAFVFLKRPSLDAATLDTIKAMNPDLHSQIIGHHATLLAQFNTISDDLGSVSTLRERMETRLGTLNSELSFFQTLAQNKGLPLSAISRGIAMATSPTEPPKAAKEAAEAAARKAAEAAKAKVAAELEAATKAALAKKTVTKNPGAGADQSSEVIGGPGGFSDRRNSSGLSVQAPGMPPASPQPPQRPLESSPTLSVPVSAPPEMTPIRKSATDTSIVPSPASPPAAPPIAGKDDKVTEVDDQKKNAVA